MTGVRRTFHTGLTVMSDDCDSTLADSFTGDNGWFVVYSDFEIDYDGN